MTATLATYEVDGATIYEFKNAEDQRLLVCLDRFTMAAAEAVGLRELEAWAADDPSRSFDPGAITVDTQRTADGRISVSVAGDWIRHPPTSGSPA